MAADDRHDDEDDLLKGWKDIARFLHASERTVQRWEHILRLPVRRAGPPPGTVVFASRTDLRAWLPSNDGAEAARDLVSAEARWAKAVPTESASAEPALSSERPARTFRRQLWAAIAVVGLVLVGVGLWSAGAFERKPSPIAARKPAPDMLLLRLTSTDGTWTMAGIPFGGSAMTTRVGQASVVLSAVREGEVSRLHLSTIEHGAGDRADTVSHTTIVTLRKGESAKIGDVPGLAKVEWLGEDALARTKFAGGNRAR